MKRRKFIQHTGIASAGLSLMPQVLATQGLQSFPTNQPYLLSSQGCGRATGYAEANKIVSYAGKTHVSWLDSDSDGFWVRIKTLDHHSGKWSSTVTLGKGHDNHGGPALTVDSKGYLHIVYFPHHHPMRYRKSRFPNDSSQWEDEIQFGERCTYPTLVCGEDDTLYFSCRRSFKDKPWQVELWTRRDGAVWTNKGAILQAKYNGYSHYQESLAWSPDHKRLHLCCRIHEKTDQDAYGRIQTVGYMYSDDFGETWTKSDGSPIQIPVTSTSIDVLASGGVDAGNTLRVGAMGIDGSGKVHVVYCIEENNLGTTYLATPNGNGSWSKRKMNSFLPKAFTSWSLIMLGGISFNKQGEMFLVAQLFKKMPEESSWGHPSCETVLFHSKDGGNSFDFGMLSKQNETVPNWLPNIERSTGHNTVSGRPAILYTSGNKGAGNSDLLSNNVFIDMR